MKCCMHMVFVNYISIVIDEYFLHFDDYYCKNDEIGPQSEVNFFTASQSMSHCGTPTLGKKGMGPKCSSGFRPCTLHPLLSQKKYF